LITRHFRKGLEIPFKIANQEHVNYLDSIFQIKGYPGIWLTGVGDSNLIAFDNNANLSEIFYIILYHYDNAFLKYGAFLKNEIQNGHIHPRTYAMIRDFRDRFNKPYDEAHMYYNI
jgi:hypothetical protein